MYLHNLAVGKENSCKIRIFANGNQLPDGKLDYRTGYLTHVKPVFTAFSIHAGSVDVSLFARLCCDSDGPEIHFFREIPQDGLTKIDWEQAPFLPFSAKSEDPYLAKISATIQVRTKEHEQLLNAFYHFLRQLGYSPIYSKAVDLAIKDPPVLVEAKAIADESMWAMNIRVAVGQLYEYRWFSLPGAKFLFLASEPVPEYWTQYLRKCHDIRSAWRDGQDFYVEDLEVLFPAIPHSDTQIVPEEDT